MFGAGAWGWLVVLALVCTADAVASPHPARVGEGVRALLETQPSVRVLVMFSTDAPGSAAVGADAVARITLVRGELLARARSARGTVQLRRTFSAIEGFAVEVDAIALEALAADPRVVRIDLDAPGTGHALQANPLARVTDVQALGLDAAGTKVAVIDSGIDLTHPDFSGRIVAQQCFCSGPAGSVGCCPNGLDVQSGPGAASDDHGHGTNVSGVMASGGVVAEPGPASGAGIVAVKVLDSGNGFCCSSDVVAAFDWILANHPDTTVVNASLGTSALFPGVCDNSTAYTQAYAAAVNALVANGTQVFVSSGNQASANAIAAPACVASATAVGAVYDSALGSATFGCTDAATEADLPTCFTNSNAVVDLYAPGANTTSSGRNGGLSTYRGTSQAAPLAAGCAAALRAHVPGASAAGVEAALKESPTRVTDPKNGLQFPRLDCLDALMRIDRSVFRDGFEAG